MHMIGSFFFSFERNQNHSLCRVIEVWINQLNGSTVSLLTIKEWIVLCRSPKSLMQDVSIPSGSSYPQVGRRRTLLHELCSTYLYVLVFPLKLLLFSVCGTQIHGCQDPSSPTSLNTKPSPPHHD